MMNVMLSMMKDKHATIEGQNIAKVCIMEMLEGRNRCENAHAVKEILEEFKSFIHCHKNISALRLLSFWF